MASGILSHVMPTTFKQKNLFASYFHLEVPLCITEKEAEKCNLTWMILQANFWKGPLAPPIIIYHFSELPVFPLVLSPFDEVITHVTLMGAMGIAPLWIIPLHVNIFVYLFSYWCIVMLFQHIFRGQKECCSCIPRCCFLSQRAMWENSRHPTPLSALGIICLILAFPIIVERHPLLF